MATRGMCESCFARPAVNSINGDELCGLCTADATGGRVQGDGISISNSVIGDGGYIGRGGPAASDDGLRIGRRYSGRANYDTAAAWTDFAEDMAHASHGGMNGVVVTGGNGVTISGSAVGDGCTVINHGSGRSRSRRWPWSA